jgi:hypothetical protein
MTVAQSPLHFPALPVISYPMPDALIFITSQVFIAFFHGHFLLLPSYYHLFFNIGVNPEASRAALFRGHAKANSHF